MRSLASDGYPERTFFGINAGPGRFESPASPFIRASSPEFCALKLSEPEAGEIIGANSKGVEVVWKRATCLNHGNTLQRL